MYSRSCIQFENGSLYFYAQFFIHFQTCCVHALQTSLNMCIIFSVLDRWNLILGSNISYPVYKAFATLVWMGPQHGAL